MTQFEICVYSLTNNCRQTFSISHTKSKKLKRFSSRIALVLAQPIQARCEGANEDVVAAALTGDAPTTYEWSTICIAY